MFTNRRTMGFLQLVVVLLLVQVCGLGVKCSIVPASPNITSQRKTYTIDELLTTVFPKKTSNDFSMDPCKAGKFEGDIGLVPSKPTLEETLLQEELTKYKPEVLESLQIEEEGLTSFLRKKSKHAQETIQEANSKRHNEPLDSTLQVLRNGQKLKNGRVTKTADLVLQERMEESKNNQRKLDMREGRRRRKRHHILRDNDRQGEDLGVPKQQTEETSVHDFQSKFDKNQKSSSSPGYSPQATNFPHRRTTRAATAKKDRIWEYGVVPYEIDEHFSGGHKALFKQAMKHWERFTCVRFVERKKDEHKNFIIFTERPCGCCSFVGKVGDGGQAISIGKNCDRFGVVVHELGHVLGFWHEHTRPDRDNHVRIIWDNIMTGQQYNFNKLSEEEVNSLGQLYDHGSIMHYSRNTFSKGTYWDTIQPIDVSNKKRLEMGQRARLSDGDIIQMNLLYNCPKCGRTYQAKSASFSSPSNVSHNGTKSNESCEWRITANHGERIVLNITKLDIEKSAECNSDYIEIRDGHWYKSPLLGKFCGTTKPNSITSTGSRLLISYVTKHPEGHLGFSASYEAICGGELTIDNEAFLESPNYPEDYPPSKECIWKITVPENYQVALSFHSFDVENQVGCVFDYVEIRDGLGPDSPIIGVYCGYDVPGNVLSTNNQLLVKFVSDGSVQKGGFSATVMKEYDECNKIDHGCAHDCVNILGGYECRCKLGYELQSDKKSCEAACGGLVVTQNGTITSPGFPDLYPSSKNCTWEIVTSPNYRIYVNFTHFDLEGNDIYPQLCEYDRVEVYTKLDTDQMEPHGVYCGPRVPEPIMSEGNVMRLSFSSDATLQKTGFAVVFFRDMDECSIDNGGCQHKCTNTFGSLKCTCHQGFNLDENGRDCKVGDCTHEISSSYGILSTPNHPRPYPARRDCVWKFTITPGHRIRISFNFFEVERSEECYNDRVELYDGQSPEAFSMGKFCGSRLPPVLTSTGNVLYMSFVSDASVQRRGFWATHGAVCGGIFQATTSKQHIYSHANFDNDTYHNGADCDWAIKSSPGYSVSLSFLTFELEEEIDCEYDYVEIFSGADSRSMSYGRFCGTTKPPDIISDDDALLVRFCSDDTTVGKGFTMVYEAVDQSLNEEEGMDEEYTEEEEEEEGEEEEGEEEGEEEEEGGEGEGEEGEEEEGEEEDDDDEEKMEEEDLEEDEGEDIK